MSQLLNQKNNVESIKRELEDPSNEKPAKVIKASKYLKSLYIFLTI